VQQPFGNSNLPVPTNVSKPFDSQRLHAYPSFSLKLRNTEKAASTKLSGFVTSASIKILARLSQLEGLKSAKPFKISEGRSVGLHYKGARGKRLGAKHLYVRQEEQQRL
jgi:hypothetical protein